MQGLPKSDFIEHLRTNFAVYTYHCPSYYLVQDAVENHLLECECSVHWFFETEPICMSPVKDGEGISGLIGDLMDVFRYIAHLTEEKKREFIQYNIFCLLDFDLESARFNLTAPHFEICLTVLLDSLTTLQMNFGVKLSFDFFKSLISAHHQKCKGPCKLNSYGLPICGLSNSKIKKIDKMQAGMILILKNKQCFHNEIQILFDLSFQPKQYDYFINFVKNTYKMFLNFNR